MTVERFDMNRTVPPGANNLSQSLFADLEDAINRYIKAHNKTSKPPSNGLPQLPPFSKS
jgi:hypothetical protein